MILQYASAGITAEVRTMSAPDSVHSIPTCANTEDVVSMAGYSSRKAFTATELTFQVLTNELVAASRAMTFSIQHPGPLLQDIVHSVNALMPNQQEDRYLQPNITFVHDWLMEIEI